MATIHLRDRNPGLHPAAAGSDAGRIVAPYLVLLRKGFAETPAVARPGGELLPHRFTLAPRVEGGLFSVALSFPRHLVRGILQLEDFLPCGVRTFLSDTLGAAALWRWSNKR